MECEGFPRMGKRPTAKEVAEAAGVSKWTVIRAFTPGASIAEKSRAKVMAVAHELNYSPNLLARSLATNLTHQVAAFVDDFDNPHKLPLIAALTEIMQSEGLVVSVININTHFDHIHALLSADQRQIDAVLLCGTAFRDEMLTDARLGPGTPPMFRSGPRQPDRRRAGDHLRRRSGDGRNLRLSRREALPPARVHGAVRKPCRRRSAAIDCSAISGWGAASLRCRIFRPRPTARPRAPRSCAPIWSGHQPISVSISSCARTTSLLLAPWMPSGTSSDCGFPRTLPWSASTMSISPLRPPTKLTTYEQPIALMVRKAADMILGRDRQEDDVSAGKFVPRATA